MNKDIDVVYDSEEEAELSFVKKMIKIMAEHEQSTLELNLNIPHKGRVKLEITLIEFEKDGVVHEM